MKQLFKSILKRWGLYKSIYGFYLNRARKPYEHVDYCNMNYKEIRLMFNTIDSYSNKWFFPRFGKGSIHEPGATNVFIDFIQKNYIVFDIGAHLGYFTCVAGTLAKEGYIYAFEVDPHCIDLISKNVSLNNLRNVKILNLAVSDVSGQVSIPIFESPNPGIHIECSLGVNSREISSMSVDDFIDKNKVVPNFIKIDVEGAEYMVLNGMKKLLSSKELILLIEIHPKQLWKYYHTDYREVLKFLKAYGFTFDIVDSYKKNNAALRKINNSYEMISNEMILCRKIT